ncbi:unnamed protein product [Phaedon cochleariae]|uniref:Striatin n=1 Tax=Phaedon cochleariae TaxID=80249 RepID=A0A9N9X4E0_PHACE|nr:unnamed protein product [Phaedon cochleariae]
MEDNSLNIQNGGQMGPPSGSNANNKQSEEVNPKSHYSIPGILHFIQHEWARFELERSQWEVDRAELQGERKGQENLKNDLVRRIKMLEFALKQERAKFHKLKYGTELQQGDMKPPFIDESGESQLDSDQSYISVSNSTWKQGRQLLRQYLQEIGYTDRIIDVRSTRVRSLLGLNNNNADQEENHNSGSVNGNESNKRASETQDHGLLGVPGRRTPAKKAQPSSLAEAMMLDTEAAVMANLEFLSNADVDMDDDEDMSDDVDIEQADDIDDDVTIGGKKGLGDDVDAIALEVFNELNRLSEAEKKQDIKSEQADWNKASSPKRPVHPSDEDPPDSSLGLGELAQLTVNNDADAAYDVAGTKEAFRKTWNAKYTLRSHFDGVRALAFHPSEPALVTASEDHTLKLWNLQKTVPAKKSASLDVEPLYTFRCHAGAVLCLAMSGSGEHCYSGGLDGAINCWNVPPSNVDPYDLYEPEVLHAALRGHQDAVWGLSVFDGERRLLSCSADGTVKLWSPHSKSANFYNAKLKQYKLCPKLTNAHLNPSNFQKMKVKYASQVFSHSVAAAFYTYVDFEVSPPEAKVTTAKFIKIMNDLFDLLNSCHLNNFNAFMGTEKQFQFLEKIENISPRALTAAIKALTSYRVTSTLVSECIDSLQRLSATNKVCFLWVPGDSGGPGNEIADGLARKGAKGSDEGNPDGKVSGQLERGSRNEAVQTPYRKPVTKTDQCPHGFEQEGAETGATAPLDVHLRTGRHPVQRRLCARRAAQARRLLRKRQLRHLRRGDRQAGGAPRIGVERRRRRLGRRGSVVAAHQQDRVPPDAAADGDGARGPAHPVLGQRDGEDGTLDGSASGRGDELGGRSERAVSAFRLARLLDPAVALGQQDLRPGDHRPPEEVRREHPGRRLPPLQAVHSQRRRRRASQSFRSTAILLKRSTLLFLAFTVSQLKLASYGIVLSFWFCELVLSAD